MKRFKKQVALAVALSLSCLSLLAAGCAKTDSGEKGASDGKNADVIRIGVFEPLTGANAAGGKMELDGVRAANRIRPEVLGKKIEIVPIDNKSDDTEAVTAAERLVNTEKVDVIIGSWGSSVCIAAAETFNKAKVPAIAASSTNPLVTQGNDYYYRVCFLDPFQGTVLAQFAQNQGYKTAAIIMDITDIYATGLASNFKDKFGAENIVAESKFNKGDQDFTAQLSTAMEKNPDVIFAPGGYTEAGLMMKQAKDLGFDVPFLGGDTWDTTVMYEVGGDATENAYFTTFFSADANSTPEIEEYLAAYAEEMNGEKPIGSVTALAYDAYMCAIEAIEKAGSTDGEAIKAALNDLEHVGVTGTFKFDENGDSTTKQAVVKTVRNLEFKYVDTVVVK